MTHHPFVFRQLSLQHIASQARQPFDAAAYRVARQIVRDVRRHGESAVRQYAQQYDGLPANAPLVATRAELDAAVHKLPDDAREVLQRTAERIRRFAEAQRQCLRDCQMPLENGRASHRWLPVPSAGCYAPGGRYPLPSSVLMTAVTARVAGVNQVWVASPQPTIETLAAAAIAGATGLLRIGGAQAIAALAEGIPEAVCACDVIVGPGNQYVTAAKAIVAQTTRIDMLAGPSELVVVAAADADPRWIAADLLAQAEHDPHARPWLVTNSIDLAHQVCDQLEQQLAELPTALLAAQALAHGGYFLVTDVDEAVAIGQQLAPEHLSLQGLMFEQNAERFTAAAALFVGSPSAEVFGDYGAGPNHVLPTGGTARRQSGLSVVSFLRCQTILQLQPTDAARFQQQISDAAWLARMEGLVGHARSATLRGELRPSP
jgi:phosphoribosyl-ATP pyrophosphohydrolase/phosphoribosyl-AMP cyclohydrolase/histidinol dehydrogenase